MLWQLEGENCLSLQFLQWNDDRLKFNEINRKIDTNRNSGEISEI